ncbi:MAG: alkaline phosphatase family protein [Bacillota bacterium]|nr:alkaline phosphatase family protein [Bacillota bacterium]
MQRKIVFVMHILLILAIFQTSPVCAWHPGELVITGDVAQEVVLAGYQGWEVVGLEYRGEAQEAIRLLPVLQYAGVLGAEGSIFLSAYDGVGAVLALGEITEECYLRLTPEYGWQFISEHHPRQAGVKFLEYVVVAAAGPDLPCLRLISGTTETVISYGSLFAVDSVQRLIIEGEAKKGDFTAAPFSRRSLIPLAQFLNKQEAAAAVAYLGDGSQVEVSLAGYLEWRGQSADYLGPDGRSRKADVKALWADAPETAVTELLSQALDALGEGRVLIILVDGLGFFELQQVQPPFLSSREVQQARTVFPSITPVALASILTGALPSEHGITARGLRELQVPDLFFYASQLGKNSALVEGNTKILNTSIRQILNPDLDGDGSTDYEVFQSAQEQLAAGVDLVFVHFHGYDDTAHSCGPFSPEAGEKLLELDGYIQALCQGFSGTVLVLADHGQHPTSRDKLGGHGLASLLDLTVPWFRWEQP